MKILVISVEYKTSYCTQDMIKSLGDLTSNEDEIDVVVVNNDGENKRYDIKENFFSWGDVKFLNSENVGYFRGLNKGLSIINNIKDYNFVIFCNNDLFFDKDFLLRLKDYRSLVSGDSVIVPRIIGTDGIDQNPQYVYKIPFFKKILFMILFSIPNKLGMRLHNFLKNFGGRVGMEARVNNNSDSKVFKVNLPLGAIFIFPVKLLEKINNLPDESFLYGEEMLLKKKLYAIGADFLMIKDLIVFHKESSTTSLIDSLFKWDLQKKAFKKFKWFYLFKA